MRKPFHLMPPIPKLWSRAASVGERRDRCFPTYWQVLPVHQVLDSMVWARITLRLQAQKHR
jgi:hypothetical protein